MSARNERGRWQLTDMQRFLLVLVVVVAAFLAAMALGGASLPLLLIAVALLATAGLTVFLVGLRQNAMRHVVATAYVVAVSPPPTDAIVAKCDMRLKVSLYGRPPVELKHRDVALAIERWPRVGQTLPVDVEPNAKHLKVRWDLIDQEYLRAPDPTPPRSYQQAGSNAAQRDTAHRDTAHSATVHRDTAPSVRLHTQFSDPSLNVYAEDPAFGGDYAPVRAPAPAVDPFPEAMMGDGERYRAEALPRGGDLGRTSQTGAPPPAAVHPDFDPAGIDRSDFEPDPTESADLPAPSIPMPRPPQQPTLRITGPGTAVPANAHATTEDEPSGGTNENASIGGMLIVSDLDRSLRFYTEKLGFTIVYAVSSNAVVEYGGARILLQHMADFSGIDRKVGHLHIQVPDLEASYNDLMAKGIDFRYRPKMVSRSDDVELWKAAFDDPDGHGVALTEWRHRR